MNIGHADAVALGEPFEGEAWIAEMRRDIDLERLAACRTRAVPARLVGRVALCAKHQNG